MTLRWRPEIARATSPHLTSAPPPRPTRAVSTGTHLVDGEGRCPRPCGRDTAQWNGDSPGAPPFVQPTEGRAGGVGR